MSQCGSQQTFDCEAMDCEMTGYELQCNGDAGKDEFGGECSPFQGGGGGGGGGGGDGGGDDPEVDTHEGDGAAGSIKAALAGSVALAGGLALAMTL